MWHTCTFKHMIGPNTSRRLHSLFSFLFLSFLSSSYFLLHPSFLSFHRLSSVFSSSYHSSSFSYHYFTHLCFCTSSLFSFACPFSCPTFPFLLTPRHSLTFPPSSCLSFPHHSFPCTPPSLLPFPLFCMAFLLSFLKFFQLTFPSPVVILPLPFSCSHPFLYLVTNFLPCSIVPFLLLLIPPSVFSLTPQTLPIFSFLTFPTYTVRNVSVK